MTVKIKYEKKQNLSLLLQKLSEISILQDGKVTYTAFEHRNLQWLFLSIIDFGNILNQESKKQILEKVFQKLAHSRKYEKKVFLECLNKEFHHHTAKEKKTFFVLATLSIKYLPFRAINFGRCNIKIHGTSFPTKFNRHTINESNGCKNDDEKTVKLSIKINSKNALDAYEEGYAYFEIFRSFLCLIDNSTYEIRFDDRNLNPINQIQVGETISVHNEDGTNALDRGRCFIVPNFQKLNPFLPSKEKISKFKKTIPWMIKQFNKCSLNHQASLINALNSYTSAFDERNKYTCFLKAWTTLELLLDSDQNDTLIKRASALYLNTAKPYKKQILESLRLFRNEFVHKGNSSAESLEACFFVQEFIKDLIIKLNLSYAGFFNTIEDANLFLDNLSLGIGELRRKKKIADKVIKLEQSISL
ncbi:hypothetical protein ABDK00_013660 [Niabella insulamsoli]|uniref:hypothetical protein n=1 Tax=Niabella insulamsoli TaxID=3144874 RepID=UPI0031FD453A